MELSEFFKEVWRGKFLFLSVIALCLCVSFIIQKYSPRVFEAETLILVDQSKSIKDDRSSDAFSAGLSQDRYLKSQVRIAQGEAVISDVINKIELENSSQDKRSDSSRASAGSATPNLLNTPQEVKEKNEFLSVQSAIKVEVEPNSDLIRIAYRSKDPRIAARYANQVANSLIERNISLYSNPLAEKFFKDQQQIYKDNLDKASKSLEKFATTNKIYSIETQRKLELSRRDKAIADLSATQSSISRLEGELGSLKIQLASLKSKMNLPSEIFGTNNFSGKGGSSPSLGNANSSGSQNLSDDPPLLHVRLYQESAQKIINFNAELAGLRASENNQVQDLRSIEKQLQVMASLSAEFSRLESDVAQNEATIMLYSRKSEEAGIQNAWKTNERLSNMQVVQVAIAPIRPVFPRGSVVYPLGLLVGLIVGCSAVLAKKFFYYGTDLNEASAINKPTMMDSGEFSNTDHGRSIYPMRSNVANTGA